MLRNHALFGDLFGCYFSPDDGGTGGGTGEGTGAAGDAGDVGGGAGNGQEPPAKTYSEDDVKGLRGEAASYRTKLRDAEKRLQELEDATKSEAQRLQEKAERADALETEVGTWKERAEKAEATIAEEVESRQKALPKEMLELLPPSLSPSEQLAWIRKASAAADKLKPADKAALPPAGGRNPGGERNGGAPTEEERRKHAQREALRF